MKPFISALSDSPGPADTWQVDITEKGRHGSVIYSDCAESLSFDWEFGGGDTVASIYVGDEVVWRQIHPRAVSRRAEILRRMADEVIRQKSPESHAVIDDLSGWINIRSKRTQGAPPDPASANHSATRGRNARLIMGLAGLLLISAAAAVGWKNLFSIQSPTGIPLGPSIRTPHHIATLIRTLEPYVPALHRNPDNDRFRLALFLYPIDGRSPAQRIPIAKGLRIQDFNLAKLLGCDGSTVWFNLNGIGCASPRQTVSRSLRSYLRRFKPSRFRRLANSRKRLSFPTCRIS